MLLGFTVSNFRSFDKEERFSMEAGKTRNFSSRVFRTAKSKILKFKAIYGANASGKSNIIKAIDFMQQAVLRGLPSDSVLDYCRVSEENFSRPSSFEMEIILKGIQYNYGFEVLLSAGAFLREWLIEKKGNKQNCVFSRDIRENHYNVTSYVNDNGLNERLRIYADDIKSDASILFLKVMNQNKDTLYGDDSPIEVYRTLYRWFRNKLSVNHPDEPITQYTYFFDSQDSSKAEELLEQMDTGISKVQIYDEATEKVMALFPKQFVQEIADELTEQKNRNTEKGIYATPAIMLRSNEGHSMYIVELHGEEVSCKTLKFNHKYSDSLFSLNDESDGTIRLLDLLEILLTKKEDAVYVVDEVSRCLHPLLTKKFISDFLDMANKRNIQLIVTTHESEIMDLELLRQDEIGFVKRNANGTSSIYGLEQFGARFDKRIRKAYLEGKYDAVPNL